MLTALPVNVTRPVLGCQHTSISPPRLLTCRQRSTFVDASRKDAFSSRARAAVPSQRGPVKQCADPLRACKGLVGAGTRKLKRITYHTGSSSAPTAAVNTRE